MPTLVQLGPGEPVILPTAVAFSSLVLARGQPPIQLHLHLADGTELFLPVEEGSLQKLYAHLRGFYEKDGTAP